MSFEARLPEEDPRARNEHVIIIFLAVAAFFLGSLLLLAQLASGEEEQPRHGADWATPTLSRTQLATSGGAGPRVEGPVVPQTIAPAASNFVERPVPAAAPSSPPPDIEARAFAVLERSCGALIWGKNERERLAPASLTKIITALVVDRRASRDEMVDVSVSGKQMAARGSSVMGIEPGMRLSVQDLLYGLMLPSGNDAALALANHVGGGNVNAFVDMMNDEAGRLHLYDTHFSNPHGLDNRGLYSSALDMALAGRALLERPFLAELGSAHDYAPNWRGPVLQNGNKLLQVYPGAFGVKIGYTTNAQQTIVAGAERDGRQLIVSVFGTDTRYADTIALLDWAFSQAPSACSAS